MLIIVEGPPQSGKSTFTAELAALDFTVCRPFDGQPITSSNDYLARMLNELEDYNPATSTRHIVCDEWHLSHYLYMPIVQPTRAYVASEGVFRYVEARLERLGAIVVSMDTTLSKIQSRFRVRNPFYVKDHKMESRLEGFWEAHAQYRNRVTGNLPVLSSGMGVDHILSAAAYSQRQAAKLAAYPLYAGPADPEAVFVEWNPGTYETLVPRDHSGSRHFHKWLSSDPELFTTCGMVNAADMSPEAFASLIADLGHPRLVLLGTKALASLGETYPEASMIIDPRSARRAWSAYGSEYTSLLRRAVQGPGRVMAHRWTPMVEHDLPVTS